MKAFFLFYLPTLQRLVFLFHGHVTSWFDTTIVGNHTVIPQFCFFAAVTLSWDENEARERRRGMRMMPGSLLLIRSK